MAGNDVPVAGIRAADGIALGIPVNTDAVGAAVYLQTFDGVVVRVYAEAVSLPGAVDDDPGRGAVNGVVSRAQGRQPGSERDGAGGPRGEDGGVEGDGVRVGCPRSAHHVIRLAGVQLAHGQAGRGQ